MHFIHLAQDPTPATDPQVIDAVEQATKAIDTFNNLGVFMAVLGVFVFFALAILVLVWSNRNTANIAVTTLAQVNADKAKENQELKDERREEKIQRQLNHDQFMLMIAALTARQTEGDAAVAASVSGSEQTVKQAVTSSEGRVIASVVSSKEDVLAVLKLLGKVNTDVFQPVSSEPPDLAAMQIILEDTLAAIEAAKRRMQSAPKRATSEIHTADVPTEVVITEVSQAAVDSIMGALPGNGDSKGSEAA